MVSSCFVKHQRRSPVMESTFSPSQILLMTSSIPSNILTCSCVLCWCQHACGKELTSMQGRVLYELLLICDAPLSPLFPLLPGHAEGYLCVFHNPEGSSLWELCQLWCVQALWRQCTGQGPQHVHQTLGFHSSENLTCKVTVMAF